MQDVDRLLAELERLDGAAECAVVRAALAGGVPRNVVVDELEREVERRRSRVRDFYDEREW